MALDQLVDEPALDDGEPMAFAEDLEDEDGDAEVEGKVQSDKGGE